MSNAVTCPVCGAADLEEFLHRKRVTPHQNALMTTRAAARDILRGDLSLVVCSACGFIHNQAFDPAIMAYGEDYDNAQTYSAAFRDYVDGLAQDLLEDHDIRHSRIVEVGCGDGYFLRKLVEDPTRGNSGVGFDPSYRGPDEDMEGRLRFERRFYDGDCANVAADLVVCRHVIEHIPDPVAMLRAVHTALAGAPSARLFFETPCVDWIFKGKVLWDLFYEHCSYFTATSLATAFERAEFEVVGVKHVFGGQYLWIEARPATASITPRLNAGSIAEHALRMGVDETRLREDLAAKLGALCRDKPTAIWGAGAKGVTLANLVDPERRLFDCVIDINPNKQGCFIAGAGHEIVGLEQAMTRGVEVAILMNQNYRAEIETMIQAAGSAITLIDATTKP